MYRRPLAKVASRMDGLDPFFGKWVNCPGLFSTSRPWASIQFVKKVALGLHFPMILALSAASGPYQSAWCVLKSTLRRQVGSGLCLTNAALVFVFRGA